MRNKALGIFLVFTLLVSACAVTPGKMEETLYGEMTEAEWTEEILSYYGDIDMNQIDIDALEKELIGEVKKISDIPYGEDEHFRFDIYYTGTIEELRGKPVVFVIHGGSDDVGRKDNMESRALIYAEEGYVAVSPDYKWGEAAFQIARSPQHSTACAIASFKKLARPYGVDVENMLIHGNSHGGYIGGYIVYNQEEDWLRTCPVQDEELNFVGFIGESTNYGNFIPDAFKSVTTLRPGGVDIIGPQELFNIVDKYDDGRQPRLGAINYVDSSDVPAQLFHGTADEVFDEQRAYDFAAALLEVGIQVDVYIERGAGHSIQIANGKNEAAIEVMLEFAAQVAPMSS